MIRLRDSQIVQILPEYFADRASVQALSYALNQAIKRLVGYIEGIGVFAVIDAVPEYILDMIALELNTQHYDDLLDVKSKRSLVKNTFIWYGKAGTPEAVEELVNAVFGEGEVHEWFQYGGEPYTFRIVTNADAECESIEKFEKLIERVKSIRSRIDEIMFIRKQDAVLYMGIANLARVSVKVGWEEE